MPAKALNHLSYYEKQSFIDFFVSVSERSDLEKFAKGIIPVIQDFVKFIEETKHLFHGSDPAMAVYMFVVFGTEGIKKLEAWWKYFSQIKGEPNRIYKEIISWMEYFDDPERAWAYREEGYNPAGAARLEYS